MKENQDPRMHSAEHLLNQTMIRLAGTRRCFSAHIEKRKSKCDYYFNRNLTADEIGLIESAINQIINSDLEIKEEFIDKKAAADCYDLSRLPSGADGPIRIIRIGDYDLCPCSGPHAASTKELGVFKIVSTSFDNNNVLRIRYKLNQAD